MKTIKLLLCTLLIAMCFPVQSYAISDDIVWNLSKGVLTISGYGEMPIFNSPEDQPWADVRDQIIAVQFADPSALCIDNMQYWFTDCVNLRKTEIPYTAHTIGEQAFANCSNLTDISFYYYDSDDFEIVDGAFYSSTPVDTKVYLISDQTEAMHKIQGYDWLVGNRHTEYLDVYSQEVLATYTYAAQHGDWYGICGYQGCTEEVLVSYETSSVGTHKEKFGGCPDLRGYRILACSDKGDTVEVLYIDRNDELPSISGSPDGICDYCGQNMPVDPSTCSHSSTSTTYIQTSHTEHLVNVVCTLCGTTVSTPTESHVYITKYYDSSYHVLCCSACGYLKSNYTAHTTTTKYYDSSYHGSYCTGCNTWLSNSTAHNYTSSTSGCTTTKKCSGCGDVKTSTSHTYVATGEVQQYNSSSHTLVKKCSKCGTTTTTTESCTKITAYTITDTTHQANSVCTVCGYSSTGSSASHSYYNNVCKTCGCAKSPQTGTLADIAEGSVIYINENGYPQAFYVAKHDYESDLNGEGRTLLMRANLHSKLAWNSTTTNTYIGSSIDSWLNGDYKATLDSNVQSEIDTTQYYGTSPGGTKTVSTLSSSVFLPSITEIGLTNTYANVEGSAFTSVSNYKLGYLDGTATIYWSRSPRNSTTTYANYVSASGTVSRTATTTAYGIRPCFTLPSSAYIVGDGTVLTTVEVTWDIDGDTSTETYNPGDTLTLPVIPAKLNHHIAGWYTDPTAGTKIEDPAIAPSANTTYYAQYIQRFSVTVPTTIPMAVDSTGRVSAASIQLVNASTGDVTVSRIDIESLNGWRLVPYTTDMSTIKVGDKCIGFKLNEYETLAENTQESFIPSWVVSEGSTLTVDCAATLPAVISTYSAESIISVVLVLDWANTV